MSHFFTLIAVAFLSIQLIGCTEREVSSNDPISRAISELAKRTNDDAFVIVEALPSEKYVQFYVGANQNIFFDFPISIYDPEEESFSGVAKISVVDEILDIEGFILTKFISNEEEMRLREYLKSWNIDFKVKQEKGTAPDGDVVSFFTSIEGAFDIEEEKQFEFVQGVFTEVFQLKEYTTNIVEN